MMMMVMVMMVMVVMVVMVMIMMISHHLLIFLKPSPWSPEHKTGDKKRLSRWLKIKYYVHRSTSTQCNPVSVAE